MLFIFARQKLRPRNLFRTCLLRILLDLWNICTLAVTGLKSRSHGAENIDELRSLYAAELAEGINRFFEQRRNDCPLCGGNNLNIWIRTTDLFQSKPGRFTLERCASCGHIFQNPRLSIAGLNFYYKDYYDGLGAADTEWAFEGYTEAYRQRAEAVRRFAKPARWLDVGAAYGHFSCHARSMFPSTEFDGLDMSCSINEAVRTRWVTRGFQGLFPEVAPRLKAQYDVVSFYHYLEHVLDPAKEIYLAHTVLAPGGLITIEVPNPECWFGRAFRRFWMPWVQPQHLNLLSPDNMSRVLRENGFEPLLLEGTHVSQQFDIFIATVMFLKWVAPKTGLPWQPTATPFLQLRRLLWVIGAPVLLVAILADIAFRPVARKLRIASAYRIVARRLDISDPATVVRLREGTSELQFQP